jgi:hypothetical protein
MIKAVEPSKISIFLDKFKAFIKKLVNSDDFKATFDMILDILLLGILSFLAVISFSSGSVLIKILGFGSLFWLIQSKIVPMLIQMFSSINLVRNYK